MIETIIDFFATIPSFYRIMILVGGLTIFSLIESAVPLMSLDYGRWRHAGVNLFFTMTTIVVNFFMAFMLVMSSDWAVASGFGLLQWVALPVWIELLVGLMLLDLIGAYAAHWVQHHVTWMWKFHIVHHSDQHIDTTSANRHHPGESVIRFAFTILAALVVGAPMWLVFLYQSMSVVLSQFNHANVLLPKWLDRILVMFICTPNMHHVHHHYRMPYSDMNYGNIFSFWDRIFRTYTVVDNKKLIYGVDTHMEKTVIESIAQILKLPFTPYKGHLHYEQPEKLD